MKMICVFDFVRDIDVELKRDDHLSPLVGMEHRLQEMDNNEILAFMTGLNELSAMAAKTIIARS